jgi:predicted ribosomally synthesized peptide with SipW-like signal peptide
MKKKVILSSIVTIALCLSLITGSTFALFTSEHQFNVAATAGKVKLENAALTLDNVQTMFNSYTDADTFENGGTATLNGNELELEYMTPGDAVNMTISSTNASNVKIQYKVRLLAEGELAPALEATIGTQTYSFANGLEFATGWTEVEVGKEIGNIAIQIHFPNSEDHDTQNTFQEKTGKVIVQLIAVQANGTDLYDNPPSTNP